MNGTVEYKYNLHEEFDRDNLDKSRIKDLYGYLWHYSLQERDNPLENEIRKQEWYISIARNFVNEEPENLVSLLYFSLSNELLSWNLIKTSRIS